MMTVPTTSQEQEAQYDFVPSNFLSSLFGTAKRVLLSPGLFYERMKTDGGIRNPLLFLMSCVLIHVTAGILLHRWIMGVFVKDINIIIQNTTFGIGAPFVTAGILFFIITRFFKASGTYEAAFRVNAYAAVLNLFSWIPIRPAVFVIECYRIYLIAVGLSRTFSIRVSRAVVAIVITIVIYAALGGVVAHMFGTQVPTAVP